MRRINPYNCVHKWVAKPQIHSEASRLNNGYPTSIEVSCDNGCGLWIRLPMPPIEELEIDD